jgi:ADP-ribosyl-[dinitrogen reductase] hydrolase
MTPLDRAVGTLLGLACGDAVGTTLEFKPPGTFEPITDMVGGGPFGLKPGEWTDDTSMALCLAESILDTGSLDLEDQLRRYLLWKDSGYLSSDGRCFDIGNTTRTQLERFRRTGEAIDSQPDEEAAANGSLMRLAPVPIRWHADPATAAECSGESSRTTHAAKRPVDACRLTGAMVSALIGGAAFEEVVAPSFWQWGDLHPAIAGIAGGSWRGKQPPAIRGTGYCVDALEAALWAVDGAADFRDAVLRAANLADDADTTAAIAGQLAGARWGASRIPGPWREKLVAGERMISLARGLFVAGGGDAGATAWAHDDFVHAWWVQSDQLLAGEYPGHPSPSRARQKVDVLVDAGVRTFVDLTTPADRLAPYERMVTEVAEARRLDVRHVSFPIPDLGVVADDRYDEVCDVIENGRLRGVVYVHCWGGVGRTATVIGCVLANEGLCYDEIVARLAALRRGGRKAHRPAPEMPVQHDLIRRRIARRR